MHSRTGSALARGRVCLEGMPKLEKLALQTQQQLLDLLPPKGMPRFEPRLEKYDILCPQRVCPSSEKKHVFKDREREKTCVQGKLCTNSRLCLTRFHTFAPEIPSAAGSPLRLALVLQAHRRPARLPSHSSGICSKRKISLATGAYRRGRVSTIPRKATQPSCLSQYV